jgi:hypothetical protein
MCILAFQTPHEESFPVDFEGRLAREMCFGIYRPSQSAWTVERT